MQTKISWLSVLFAGGALCAQDLSGNWQGTLQAGPQALRIIVQFVIDRDAWTGNMYSIDQTTDPFPISGLTSDGATVKFRVDAVQGSYEGKLSQDGSVLAGSWTQGVPLPLEFHKATKETA